MTYAIDVCPFEIRTPDGILYYVTWWENLTNYHRVFAAVLENEKRIERQFRGVMEPDELFLLKFMLNNAVIDPRRDALLLSSQILFFQDTLHRLFKQHRGEEVLVTFAEGRHNSPLIDLVIGISKGYPHVHVKDIQSRKITYALYRGFVLPWIFPTIIWAHYFVECIIAALGRMRRHHASSLRERIIFLSSYRHYAPEDKDNLFWGNLTQIIRTATGKAPTIVYYHPTLPIYKGYYLSQLKDMGHGFLNDSLTFRGLITDLRAYFSRRRRRPRGVSYIVGGKERGESINPLIQAFFCVFEPYFLKNRRLLRHLLAERPGALFTDSELNLLAMQLGFLKGKTKFIVMSNEVISSNYLMLPFQKGEKRPAFDYKIVYGAREKEILVKKFKYPAEKLIVFPDPRFLEFAFDQKPMKETILFISQMIPAFYNLTNKFYDRFRRERFANPLSVTFKPHPYEKPRSARRAVTNEIEFVNLRKLDFVPKYAVTLSSTLGFELLTQGAIVFFSEENSDYFRIRAAIPFLGFRGAEDLLKKITALERDLRLYESTRRAASEYLKRMYFKDWEGTLSRLIRNLRAVPQRRMPSSRRAKAATSKMVSRQR
jgi:hypothetical protein